MQGFGDLKIGEKVKGTLGSATRALITGRYPKGTPGKKIVLIGVVVSKQDPKSHNSNRYEHEDDLSPQISSILLC